MKRLTALWWQVVSRMKKAIIAEASNAAIARIQKMACQLNQISIGPTDHRRQKWRNGCHQHDEGHHAGKTFPRVHVTHQALMTTLAAAAASPWKKRMVMS